MSSGTGETLALSVPRCGSPGAADTNSTCLNPVGHLQLLSATFALGLVGVLITGIIFVSLVTFHFHRFKMKRRKMERAEEEYEKDNSPAPAKGKTTPAPFIIVRPVKSPENSSGLESKDDNVHCAVLDTAAVP
ncbi:uncharacterized protein C11orf87 homolog [Denticeps clupeoides]|uniref:Uncharacterized protein n=1 Tax=Denticeps clupeoides TaxID=299321 RepID=A0AAY4DRR7_9TELE|nr:uncharacterized protein C11orf87 homolog [Denticeps clupeoides]